MGEFWTFVGELREFSEISVIVRLSLALFLGGLVGMERERKRRPAGFRTHMLVCLGSALVMTVSQYLLGKGYALDATRLGAQVISGIGFLGAGTIIRSGRHQVKGLTTAAGLWTTACVGLAVGIGFYEGALMTCVVVLSTETILVGIDRRIMSTTRTMNLYVEFTQSDDIQQILGKLKEMQIRIIDVEIGRAKGERSSNPNALVLIDMRKKMPHSTVIAALSGIEGVSSVEEL